MLGGVELPGAVDWRLFELPLGCVFVGLLDGV